MIDKKMSISDLSPELFARIANNLDSFKEINNFQMTNGGVYDAVHGELHSYTSQAQRLNAQQRLPLHSVMQNIHTPVCDILSLIDAHVQGLLSFDHQGNSPYYYALKTRDSAFILGIIENAPQIALLPTTIRGNNVFHTAFQFGVDMDVIERFLDVCPQELSTPNNAGCNPFYYLITVENQQSVEEKNNMIQYVIDSEPTILTIAFKNLYPLHYAIKYKLCSDIVNKMIEVNPQVARIPFPRGRSTIALAIAKKHNMSVVFNLIHAAPDDWSNLEIDTDILKNVSFKTLNLLFDMKRPLAWSRILDIPIAFWAVNYGLGLRIIRLMIMNHRQVLYHTTTTGSTLLHWAVIYNPDIKVIRYIVSMYAGSVARVDAWGKIPLHYAQENDLSEDIIKVLTPP